MATDSLREHLEWHLRRLKSARAAAAELSLRPGTDGLQWLTATHMAVLALEATLAEDLAPDHSALAEVIADLTRPAPAAGEAPSAAPTRYPADLAESWTAALTSFSALAFPWRPPPRPAPARREPSAG